MENRRSDFREFQIFSCAGSWPAVCAQTGRQPRLSLKTLFLQSLLPLQIARRRATAARKNSRRGSPPIAAETLAPMGAILAEFRPRHFFSPRSQGFSEVFTLCQGLTSQHSLAYGNADRAMPNVFARPGMAHRRTGRWRRSEEHTY